MQMTNRTHSGGIGGRDVMSPSIAQQSNNCLFTLKKLLSGNALSARPYRWLKKRIRDIIHVGLNTLSRVYKVLTPRSGLNQLNNE